MNITLRLLVAVTAFLIALAPDSMAQEAGGHAAMKHVSVPPGVDTVAHLEQLRQAQLATAGEFEVFVDFGFVDRQPESGITFKHRVVDDAGKTYKAVHYDHGNGIAIADVDQDGLYDIYFPNQVGANELWRNLGGGRFENITARAGVGVEDRISVTASFADIDNDGDPDLYVTTVRRGNLLFRNDGDGNFTDITASSGLGHKGHSSGAVFFDYNADGLLDLFLTNVGEYSTELPIRSSSEGIEYTYFLGYEDAFSGHRFPERTEPSILFRNLGDNRFQDVSEILFLADFGWSGDATIIDVNDDGWPDIYELNMQGQDHYYENMQGASFLAKSRAIFPKTSWGAMGIKVFDWNNDGRMDIFITDMHSDMSQQVSGAAERQKSDMQWPEEHLLTGGNSIFGNSFFEKQEDGSYAEISDRIGAENFWPWGLSTGDLNADGYQDALLTTSMNYPFRYQVNTLLINDRAKRFRDAEFILGIEPRRDGRHAKPWFELDCGGPDKNTNPDCQGHDGPITVLGALGSRSSVIFDLDNDGDLDIVTNDFNSEPMVLVSNLAERRGQNLHYLKIRLQGTESNRDALFAKVTVKAGGISMTQVHDGKSGYLSQSAQPLYFGLGKAEKIDTIEVRWPSGIIQTISSPRQMNTTMVIAEPAVPR